MFLVERIEKGAVGMSQQPSEKEGLLLNWESTSLFDLYGQAIFGYVRLHIQSRDEIKDITLEVFQAALERDNLSWMKETEQLTWLRRVASNKIVDRYRRATRHPEIALEMISETVLDDDASNPEYLVLQQEAHSHLRQLLQRLPLLQQQILRLRYGDRLSFVEIGRLLEKEETTIRKHHSRILARLRDLYDHQKGE
jgi:RNA polymerase sigma factor (sigma-70 family)